MGAAQGKASVRAVTTRFAEGTLLMTKRGFFSKTGLRRGAALQALAMLGAGAGAVAIATPAMAQDYTQVNATGRVLGTDGTPLGGATVTVTSTAQGFTRSATTQADGSYAIAALPQGTYSFTITADGYDSFTDPAVRLIRGRAANQFNLQPVNAGTSGDIVVTAGRVQVIDFSSNTVGQTIDRWVTAQNAEGLSPSAAPWWGTCHRTRESETRLLSRRFDDYGGPFPRAPGDA